MRSRIARTIVGVTALVLVVLGVPFAIVIQRFYENRTIVELQRSAAEAIAELALPLQADAIAAAAGEPDAPADFSVYDADGTRLYGAGPARLDATAPDELVVVSPVTDRTTETVVGSVRVSRPRADVAAQARRAWALMALAAIGGLVLAYLVARREAARLSAPLSALAARAERLGSGEFTTVPDATGTPEIDTLAEALTVSARRLEELLAREREFSAHASHQLRTPLAGLKVSLERGDLTAASAEADRLSATVDHMLALARNALPGAEVIEVGPVVAAAAGRWRSVFDGVHRTLDLTVDRSLPGIRARVGSIEQTLDVLLDNALRHGAGTVRLIARPARGGLVVQVDDDGHGIDPRRVDSVFERQRGVDSSIGLALARTLVEADGGRLLLTHPGRAQFQIVFASA